MFVVEGFSETPGFTGAVLIVEVDSLIHLRADKIQVQINQSITRIINWPIEYYFHIPSA